jgi:hypothetical protein
MAVLDESFDERARMDTEYADTDLGEVPDGVVGAGLYAERLESLRTSDAFGDGVLSLPDSEGGEQEIPLEDVEGAEHYHETNRTKIRLRNGAIIVVSGAVIAGAVAAIRYRRKRKQ